MSQLERKFCRLCAKHKKATTLIEMSRTNDLATKASMLSVDMYADDRLPKAVCLECNEKLENTVAFMNSVAKAQEILKNGFDKVKVEILSDSEDSQTYEIPLENNDECEDDLPIIQLLKVNQKRDLTESWLHYPWLCSECNIILQDRETLWQHWLDCHQKCAKYKCADCNRRKISYTRYSHFVDHVVTHRKHLHYWCFLCNERFSNDKDVLMHSYHHKKVCKKCGRVFDNEENFNEHLLKFFGERKISNKEDTFVCKHCKKNFKCLASLQNHESTHTVKSKDFTCDECGRSYFNKSKLIVHLASHDARLKRFKCEVCGQRFMENNKLRVHATVHSGVKPFSCEQCGRQFRLEIQLKSHLVTHTDFKPFVCSVCQKRFRLKPTLTQHMRQHTGEKPYSCSKCSMNFTNWGNHNMHMKRRHGLDMSKKKREPAGKSKLKDSKNVAELPLNQIDKKPMIVVEITEPKIEKLEIKEECWG